MHFKIEKAVPVEIALLGEKTVAFSSILHCFDPAQAASAPRRDITRIVNSQSTKATIYHYDPSSEGNLPPLVNVVMVCFNLSSDMSFTNAEGWIGWIKERINLSGMQCDTGPDGRVLKECRIILVGDEAGNPTESVTQDKIDAVKAYGDISAYVRINSSTGKNTEALLETAMTHGSDVFNRRSARLKEQATPYMKTLAFLHRFHKDSAVNIAAGTLLAIGLIGTVMGLAGLIGLGLTLTSLALVAASAGFFATKNPVADRLESFRNEWTVAPLIQ